MRSYIPWLKFPFVRYILPLVIGVIYYSKCGHVWSYEVDGIVFCASILLYLVIGNFCDWPTFTGLLFFSIMFLTGFIVTGYDQDTNKESHILNIEPAPLGYMGIITEDMGATTKSNRYLVKITNTFSDKICSKGIGKTIIYLDSDSIVSVGHRVMIFGFPTQISSPLTPFGFNYRKYMYRKGITHHHFVNNGALYIIENKSLDFYSIISSKLRLKAVAVIQEAIQNQRERSVVMAILIGNKTFLEEEIKSSYSDAGAMHILAVSGLHVGIIYFMLLQIIKRIPIIGSNRVFQQLVSISSLWLFAGITGLSASVVRSVIMFSFFGFGEALNRHSSPFNTLSIAAFMMIIFSPYIVYDVGFQLSFLAVLGILYLQPKIFGLFVFKNKVADWIWSLSTVGIAAQIATFPLGLYYFGKFSNYFIISNILVIPLATLIVCLGVVILIVHTTDLFGWLEFILEKAVFLTNEILIGIASIPFSTSSVSGFSQLEVLLLYTLILLIVIFFIGRKFPTLILLILCIGMLLIQDIIHIKNIRRPRIVYYAISDHCFDFFLNNYSWTICNAATDNQLRFSILPSRKIYGTRMLGPPIERVIGKKSKLVVWNDKSILIQMEDLSFHKPLQIDYLLNESNYVDSIVPLKYLDEEEGYKELL